MPLVVAGVAQSMKTFIKKVNQLEQKDQDAAIDAYCEQLEKDVYNACKNITITIPKGAIIVTTPQGIGTNPAPIILNKVVS